MLTAHVESEVHQDLVTQLLGHVSPFTTSLPLEHWPACLPGARLLLDCGMVLCVASTSSSSLSEDGVGCRLGMG